MTVKSAVRSLPGSRILSLARQRLAFNGSADYWEKRYLRGGDSGAGSSGSLAASKASFLNEFVRSRQVVSVTEFGCGDGRQLALASYPRYIGLDVSPAAIHLCGKRFASDRTKSFFRYDPDCFVDNASIFGAELTISLDVLYHLVEDRIFEAYMSHLFAAARQYVVIYATNTPVHGTAPHVRHRAFVPWVERNCPDWVLSEVAPGQHLQPPPCADFFVYQRLASGRNGS